MSISAQDMENDDISLWLTPLRAPLILRADTPPSPQRRAIGGFVQRKGLLQAVLAQADVSGEHREPALTLWGVSLRLRRAPLPERPALNMRSRRLILLVLATIRANGDGH